MRTIIPFHHDGSFAKPGEDRVSVTLPHTWNNRDGQDGGGDYWRGECVYEKTFAVPDRKADDLPKDRITEINKRMNQIPKK